MTTWVLWIGAAPIVGGSDALVKRQTVAACILWLLAALAFAAVFVRAVTASVISAPLVLAVVAAIVVTQVLVTITVAGPLDRWTAGPPERKELS
jgi:hypothetical protein